MSLKRTTFSELWYRVASLKPSLHPSLKVWRQSYRNELWYVLEDPVNHHFFRISYAAYQFLALLDGTRTVNEVWELSIDQYGDDAPTQGEAIQLLGELYSSNLLFGDIPSDSATQLKRYKKRVQNEVTGQLKNFLFLKIPLWDPNSFLSALSPIVRHIFTVPGLFLWLTLIVAGLTVVMGNVDELMNDNTALLSVSNLPYMYASFVFAKVFHEFAHAFACKKFGNDNGSGGNVHSMGIMMLILTPLPFVDCSSSWSFKNKWQRMMVGATGIMTDLAIASIALFVWQWSAQGSVIHALAYNIIFVNSISSILFNGNPLMRYDAYYILSDFLEIANLSTRSNSYFLYLCRKNILGVKDAQFHTSNSRERFWLLGYSISSFLYRLTVMTGITLYLADLLFVGGLIFGTSVLYRMILKPVWQYMKYLSKNPELRYCRQRALTITSIAVVIVSFIIAVQKFPDRIRIEGVVQSVNSQTLYTQADGFLSQVNQSHSIQKGETILKLENPFLEAELDKISHQIRKKGLEYQLLLTKDIAHAQILRKQVKIMENSLKLTKEKVKHLSIISPFTGNLKTDNLTRQVGAYLPRGSEIGELCGTGDLEIQGVVNQYHIQILEDSLKHIEIRVKNRPEQKHLGNVTEFVEIGTTDLPSSALGFSAGGEVHQQMSDPTGEKAAETFFEIRIKPQQTTDYQLLAGQVVIIRCELPDRSIASQVWRSIKQQFQKRFKII